MRVEVVKDTENYIMIRLHDVPLPLDHIRQWCQQHECGKRVSAFHFAFKSKAEYSMFLLRWK